MLPLDLRDTATLPKEVQDLCVEAKKVRDLAYTPYSKFNVGAALLTAKGTVFVGCNVENASFGLTICAERSAIVSAVSSGEKEFRHVAVCAQSLVPGNYVSPCGACRQVLAEFATHDDIQVYLISPNTDKVLVSSVRKLLPLGYASSDSFNL